MLNRIAFSFTIGATKEDIDEVFVDVDALHRRALFTRIQEHNEHSRRLKKAEDELEGYSGVRIMRDKAFILLGETAQIKMYRGKNGNLKIVAPSVEFVTGSLTVRTPLFCSI